MPPPTDDGDTWRPQQRRFWEEPKFFLVYNSDTRCFVLAQLHFNAYCNNPHQRAFIQEGNFKKNYQEYQTQLIKKKASNNEKSILRVMGFNKKNLIDPFILNRSNQTLIHFY